MSVKDDGIGISHEDLPHIFTPFFRSNEEKSRLMNQRGHGLGLYICKKICESFDGEFNVESELGYGSKFTASIRANQVMLKRKTQLQKTLFDGSLYNQSQSIECLEPMISPGRTVSEIREDDADAYEASIE